MRTDDSSFGTAGRREPSVLIGRDDEISAVRYAFGLTERGEPAQPIVFVGLRGMGKTAMLLQCVADPSASNAVMVCAEASTHETIATTLRRGLERVCCQDTLSRELKSEIGAVLDVLPTTLLEPSDDLARVGLKAVYEAKVALLNALETLNDATRRDGRHLVFVIDEIQRMPVESLRDLIRFIHVTASTTRPVYLLAAGLPESRGHLFEARTYTERCRYFRLTNHILSEHY